MGDDLGDSTPAIKYTIADHLGSSCILLDENGTLVSREEFTPFGETSFGSYGKKRYRFCGKEKDEESGLYAMGARMYSAWTCRFMSVDPLAGMFPDKTPFHYASNNPLNRIDPSGMADVPAGEGGGGGAQGGNPGTASDGTGASDRKGRDVVHGVETEMDKRGNVFAFTKKGGRELASESYNLSHEQRDAIKNHWKDDPAKNNNITTTEHSPADVVKDVATGTGSNAVVAAKAREGYTEKVGKLIEYSETGSNPNPTKGSMLRNEYIEKTRKVTPEPYRSMTEKLKPSSSLEVKPQGRFWVTNEKVNNTMKKVGKAGTVGVVIGLGVAAYNINDAYQKGGTEAAVKQTVQEGFSWGGAAVGAATLGWAGAKAGGFLGPKGAIVGGVLGSIVGGVAGGYLGEKGFKMMFSGW